MLNEKLRRAREQKRWTIETAAEKVGVSWLTYSRWERGTHTPHLSTLDLLCQAFDLSPEDLGLARSPQQETRDVATESTHTSLATLVSPPAQIALPRSSSDEVEVSEQDIESDDDMNRREATKQIAALISDVLFMAPQDLFNAQSLERLTRAFAKPSKIDEQTLKHFGAITESCWHLMMGNELEIAEQTIWGYLPKLVVLAKQPSEHQQTSATIASQGYLLAASLAGHRNDLHARERYCEQALQFGNLAQDRNLQMAALKQLALTFEYNDRPGAVLQTYQKAIPYLNEISPLLRARMYAGLAGAHAQCGQKLGGQEDQALRALALAYESFPEKPEDDPGFLYADCDYYTIVLWDGLVHLDLDQPKAARTAFERIDGLQPKIKLPEKVRIEFLNYQAETFSRLGKLDRACAYLEEAVSASLALGSERRYNESVEVYKEMRIVWRNEPRVRKLGAAFVR
jgi:transcriptional regulator with XRE-family HTH domain